MQKIILAIPEGVRYVEINMPDEFFPLAKNVITIKKTKELPNGIEKACLILTN